MKEYVKQPEHKAGTAGKEPQAQKQAPLGELLQAYKNNSRVQRVEAGDREDAEEELNAMLENLETIVMQAMQIPGQEAEKKDAFELAERLRQLHIIADGNNEEAKSALLEGLKEELKMAGSPPALANVPPVQRLKPWQWGLIGTGAVIGLGVLAYKTYTYIRDRREDRIVQDFFAHGVIPAAAIPAELTAGVAGLPVAAQAAQIFQNINNFRFRYIGTTLNAQLAYSAHQGDCGTLMLMYEDVAAHFGVPTARGNIPHPMLVNPGPIHGRTAHGNTEGETDWYFQNHHWIVGNGVPYDLLFRVSPPPATVAEVGAGIHNGVNYRTFADGRVLIEPGQNAAWSYVVQGEGLVLANVAAAQAFIAAHP